VLEVLQAIDQAHGAPWGDILAIAARKRTERGAFLTGSSSNMLSGPASHPNGAFSGVLAGRMRFPVVHGSGVLCCMTDLLSRFGG
jgi:hypothetical protein